MGGLPCEPGSSDPVQQGRQRARRWPLTGRWAEEREPPTFISFANLIDQISPKHENGWSWPSELTAEKLYNRNSCTHPPGTHLRIRRKSHHFTHEGRQRAWPDSVQRAGRGPEKEVFF